MSKHHAHIRHNAHTVTVFVHGCDSRMLQSAEALLRAVADEAGADVSSGDNPDGSGVVPDEDYYMGFTAEDEPDYIAGLVSTIEAEARRIPWLSTVAVVTL